MSCAVKMNGANIDTKIALKTQGFLQISFLYKKFMVRKCENVTQAIHAVHAIPSLSDFMN